MFYPACECDGRKKSQLTADPPLFHRKGSLVKCGPMIKTFKNALVLNVKFAFTFHMKGKSNLKTKIRIGKCLTQGMIDAQQTSYYTVYLFEELVPFSQLLLLNGELQLSEKLNAPEF